jgi:hypothetical protein
MGSPSPLDFRIGERIRVACPTPGQGTTIILGWVGLTGTVVDKKTFYVIARLDGIHDWHNNPFPFRADELEHYRNGLEVVFDYLDRR